LASSVAAIAIPYTQQIGSVGNVYGIIADFIPLASKSGAHPFG
jgi:hypothetical protein